MTSDVAFELRSQDLLQLARRRGRRGAWLFGFSIFGLLFGTFWMFWGVIVFLTGVGLVNGVIVFLFGGVGPTLGASLVAWAGVRRRRDAEELEQLAILAETRGDVTLGEAAHLLSESEAHAAKLLNVASSAGAARMVQSSALRAPLPLGPERQNLSAFRKARRRRALLLGVAALGVLGFATLWLVVGIAGIATAGTSATRTGPSGPSSRRAEPRSAAPNKRPMSDGLIGLAWTCTRTSSAPGTGTGRLTSDTRNWPSAVISVRSWRK